MESASRVTIEAAIPQGITIKTYIPELVRRLAADAGVIKADVEVLWADEGQTRVTITLSQVAAAKRQEIVSALTNAGYAVADMAA